MFSELLAFIKAKGHKITDEVRSSAEQLSDIIGSENDADITGVLKWLEKKRKDYSYKISEVPIHELDKWKTDPKTGHISHETGKFFQIVGIKVEGAGDREVVSWTQPIIKQHECGILGIIRQKRDGVMKYLLYAKSEPGAIVNPQLSPTLQATASNLARAHGGKKPRYAEYFEDGGKGKVIVSVEHVEDPSRFYLKTNRCMMVEIPESDNVETPEDYIWLTLPQIKKLLKTDKAINALARNVFGSL